MSRIIGRYDLPSEEFCSDDLTNIFGKYEMEVAARKVIKLVRDEGTWEIILCEDDFESKGDERDGFFDLIEHGWLVERDEPERFEIHSSFVQRLKRERPQYFKTLQIVG